MADISNIPFRDLNKNGKLDPYEDPRRPIDERVEDLLGQMTLEEKAGLLFHTVVEVATDGSLMPNMRFSQASITDTVTARLIDVNPPQTTPLEQQSIRRVSPAF